MSINIKMNLFSDSSFGAHYDNLLPKHCIFIVKSTSHRRPSAKPQYLRFYWESQELLPILFTHALVSCKYIWHLERLSGLVNFIQVVRESIQTLVSWLSETSLKKIDAQESELSSEYNWMAGYPSKCPFTWFLLSFSYQIPQNKEMSKNYFM